jgi:hypothetical protein
MGIAGGPPRLLGGVYVLFAIAATARSTYQAATRFPDAPLAYALSSVAAVVYIVATVALRLGRRSLLARAALVELGGVLAVGTLSLLAADAFPDETVWSQYGRGYGFVPLVLPIATLTWLRRARPAARTDATAPS